MRCGHNVEKGEASTAHRLLRTASGVAFCRGKSLQVEDARAAGRVADSNQQEAAGCAGVDFMRTVIALACRDYFLLRNGLVSNRAAYALRRWRS
jgi:hypothetical protein